MFPGKHVQAVASPQHGAHDLVVETCDLTPVATRHPQPVGELAAVAVGHAREHVARAHARGEPHFGNARELASDHVPIRLGGLAEAVEVDLLEEMQILWRPFALVRVARVPKARGVRVPRDAAAARRVVDARNAIAEIPACGHVVDSDGTVLAAARRQTNGDEAAIQRWFEEVDGDRTARIEQVGVDDHALAREIVRRAEHHQQRLLLRRLVLDREQNPAALAQIVVVRRELGREGTDPRADRRTRGDRVQMRAGVAILRFPPLAHLGRERILEPTIGIDDGHTVVGVDHRSHGCRRRGIVGGFERAHRRCPRIDRVRRS